MLPSSHHQQSGFALVELMLALLFSTMMVGGAVAIFGFGKSSLDEISYKSSLFELSANVEDAFSSRNTFTGLTYDVANSDLGVVPTNLSNGFGPGGADIDLTTVALDGVADKGYEITLSFDEAEDAYQWCVALLENTRGYWRETGPASDILDDHSVLTLSSSCDGETDLVLRR